MGSSQTKARTCVPCIGRHTLNHCATREALVCIALLSPFVLRFCPSVFFFLITIFYFLNLFIFKFIYLFLWLCWVFVSVQGLSLVAASGGNSSSRCAGLSLSRPLLFQRNRLQTHRLRNCGSRAQPLLVMQDLPRPGLEPVFPALAGRFSTTAPPGKPYFLF